MASSSKVVVEMKLLINSRTKKVLFAEANKDCVDFLFQILSLPIASVIELLRERQGMVGSLGNLYESIENLNYIQPGQTIKDALLKQPSSSTKQLVLYRCNIGNCLGYNYSDDKSAVCPICRKRMTKSLKYVAPRVHRNKSLTSNYGGASSTKNSIYKCGYCGFFNDDLLDDDDDDDDDEECVNCGRLMSESPPIKVQKKGSSGESGAGGFVKGVVSYMVMDDLEVKPMSTVSTLTFLNKFDVKEVGVLTEKEVKLGINEAVKLLKTSLHSKTVLTDVFLGGTVTID